MKTVLTVIATLAVVALAAVGFLYSGRFDVAANRPDSGLLRWALSTAADRSVARLAQGVQVPPLTDPEMLKTGFVRYRENCVTCHGAPGVEASEIGQGLNPYPPELASHAAAGDPRELFWIVKNGIRMTGMPSFGVTHTDAEIWAIVAFLEKLPKMSPQEYQAMAGAAQAAPKPPA